MKYALQDATGYGTTTHKTDMEGRHEYGTEGYNRPGTYPGQVGRDYDVDRERDAGTAVGAGTGGGMLSKAKEVLVDRPVEAVKVRKEIWEGREEVEK